MASPTSTTPAKNLDSEGPKINQCCVCYDTYNRTNRAPVAMPCGHTFCRHCIRQMTTEKLFSCGICRTVSLINWNGTKNNLALIQILESMNLLALDDVVEEDDETDDSSSEITDPQGQAILGTMETLTNFIMYESGDNSAAVDLLEEASNIVKDAYLASDMADNDESVHEVNMESEHQADGIPATDANVGNTLPQMTPLQHMLAYVNNIHQMSLPRGANQ